VLLASEPWVRWDWVARHLDVIAGDVGQHVQLTVIAVLVGLLISAPLGLAAARRPVIGGTILSAAGILYTIPSLALFALLVPFTGISLLTSEIGLVSYTLLILVRNIVAGLNAVPAEIVEASEAMGFRPRTQLLRIELPLALPVILAGVRIATVTTIGLVTITALIGQGGLGALILDGLITDFPTELVVGAGLSIALALIADVALAGLQRALTPWAR
jgi:osmoprotectant transport system permease protein